MEWNSEISEDSDLPVLEHGELTILTETARHKDTLEILFLTNKRLIEYASGLFSRRVHVTLNLPLEGIGRVQVEGTLTKKLVVQAKKGFIGNFPTHLEFSMRRVDGKTT